MAFFQMFHKFSEGQALGIGPFQKVQREVISFPYVVRKNEKPPYIVQMSGPYIFWTPVKSNISDVWKWNCWNLFVSEIEMGAMASLSPPPEASPLQDVWLHYLIAVY